MIAKAKSKVDVRWKKDEVDRWLCLLTPTTALQPTEAEPGSAEKLAMMIMRWSLRKPLFHKGDRCNEYPEIRTFSTPSITIPREPLAM